jgi:methylthioribose-1-phosphate isomerase
VAAPTSTFDLALASGAEIPIEERSEDEVRRWFGVATVAPSAGCWNPAFDVTPADLVAGIITERGILGPVTVERIRRFFGGGGYKGA